MEKILKIVTAGDFHIGLTLEGQDQTSNIEEVLNTVVNKAIELQKNFEVLLVLGGDLFNSNDPSEGHIGAFLRVLSLIKEHNIKTFIMVGNHESRANPERLSCLSFIKDAEIGYPMVSLIEDISYIDYGTSINGRLHLTFLPHISKALIEKKKLKCTPQEYIDDKSEKILRKCYKNIGDHIVFSHLNVIGAHSGSEANLLKRSDVYLPKCMTNGFLIGVKPTIIQFHLHSRTIMENINIIGSPVFCSFGETGEKGFAVITIGQSIGDEWGIEYFSTNAPEFIELEIDMINKVEPFFKIPEIKAMIKQIPKDRKSVLKIDVTINPENNTYDWKKIHTTIVNHFPLSIVKQIVPRIVSKRLVRNANQKIGLLPDQAIQAFIKTNWKTDKVKAREIYKTAKQYIGAN